MTTLTAKCRHCARPIEPHLDLDWWLDADGFYRCIKDVNHEPMPAALGEPWSVEDASWVEDDTRARRRAR